LNHEPGEFGGAKTTASSKPHRIKSELCPVCFALQDGVTELLRIG
jgi:hypothetical protein